MFNFPYIFKLPATFVLNFPFSPLVFNMNSTSTKKSPGFTTLSKAPENDTLIARLTPLRRNVSRERRRTLKEKMYLLYEKAPFEMETLAQNLKSW